MHHQCFVCDVIRYLQTYKYEDWEVKGIIKMRFYHEYSNNRSTTLMIYNERNIKIPFEWSRVVSRLCIQKHPNSRIWINIPSINSIDILTIFEFMYLMEWSKLYWSHWKYS